jgi:hypothetical protein|tara:strand:+ start:54 stop:479 length:426 start_codon:yes stop_codon:yes gene_type:complete
MTKKGLIKIIREVVRSEVKKEVQKIFMNENKTAQEPQVQSKPRKKYTQNKSLNDVLNETVGLKTSERQNDEYPTLGGGTFDSSRMAELMGYGKSDEVKRDMVAIDTLKKAGKSVDDVPEAVTNALTRDYSELMKAMNKKGK